jgi:NADH-quinone oxidoreductase subunit L
MLTLAAETSNLELAKWIPVLPAAAAAINGFLAFSKSEAAKKAAGWITTLAIGLAFAVSVLVMQAFGVTSHEVGEGASGKVVTLFQWINIGNFHADFSFYIDSLTIVMLMVVTGIGTLIALYAQGYMKGDPGYARFFTYIAIFIFAMTCLVMGDNLLLLYLGWEGVGLASYLLIGFYYRKPSAAAAAKKAFIVNRVGDFGFALGLMGVFIIFGTVQYTGIFPNANDAYAAGFTGWQHTLILWIPFLLMLGAFGKSAQLPLHVWLPDAMEGPTPVSALIHAATMVTAGVYMISRLVSVFQLSPYALPTVATVGAITAVFAATIALCQYDIKRVWAYSTVSQLGYMFLGVGCLATTGAVFHLFTHAFFKALLFLTAGSVMHACAGQLDLRHMSGLFKKMPLTAILMLIGCLALAGVPFTSGFFSKDQIIAETLVAHPTLGWIGIITALLTAFYTFRLWFRVFMGPTQYEMGDEHFGYSPTHHPWEFAGHGHGHDHGHAHNADAAAQAEHRSGPDHGHGHDHGHHHEPHEMPFWPMNLPLCILAVGALAAGFLCNHWMETMVHGSSAGKIPHNEHAEHAVHEAHGFVSMVTGGGAIVMIVLAAFFHWFARPLTDTIARVFRPVVILLNNKYYIDELYHAVIVAPLRGLAWVCYMIDRAIVDGLIINTLFGRTPRAVAQTMRPMHSGVFQGYARVMALGLVVIALIVAFFVLSPGK